MIKFIRSEFYPKKQKLFSSEIVDFLGSLIIKSNINKKFEILDISSLKDIKEFSILFVNDSTFKIKNCDKDFIILTDKPNFFDQYDNLQIILVNDFNKSYNSIINHLYLHEDSLNFSDDFIFNNDSYFSKFSNIDKSSKIGKNCLIGRGVKIGKNTIIKNNVIIKNSIIGDNVIIGDNSTIGSSGFGFDLKNMGSKDLYPHIGIVYICNNVCVGSNCTFDRGKIDSTYIGENSMIDNLVHLAHNVYIGQNACIAAQSGFAGSVTVGSHFICGGQSAFNGHINIGNNVIVAGKSGVTKNLSDNSIVAGFPATDINKWKKSIILSRKKNA